jgi:hypothetical protein
LSAAASSLDIRKSYFHSNPKMPTLNICWSVPTPLAEIERKEIEHSGGIPGRACKGRRDDDNEQGIFGVYVALTGLRPKSDPIKFE